MDFRPQVLGISIIAAGVIVVLYGFLLLFLWVIQGWKSEKVPFFCVLAVIAGLLIVHLGASLHFLGKWFG